MKTFTFGRGYHTSRDKGMCVMEVAAYIAGEEHSDNPKCASPAIGKLARWINDLCTDEDRNELMQDIPWRVIGTNVPEFELIRAKKVEQFLDKYAPLTFVKCEYGSIVVRQPYPNLATFTHNGIALLDELISMTEIKENVVQLKKKELV